MATDKTGEVQGSSTSGKDGGGKNISALLKKLKGKINKNSDQKNLQVGANKGSTTTGTPVVASTGIGPTSNPDMPFVGADAQKYLVDSQLKGFGFGRVVTDFSAPATSFGAGGTPPASPFGAGGTPPASPFGAGGTPSASPFGAGGTPPASPFGVDGKAPLLQPTTLTPTGEAEDD